MKTSFRKSFMRDLKKLKDETIRDRIRHAIEDVEIAALTQDISAVKKLAGTDDCYRLRVGEYRLGLIIEGDVATFVRCLHRKDLYRFFP